MQSGSALLIFIYLVLWLWELRGENESVTYRLMRYDGRVFITQCNKGKGCKRTDGFATVPWGSPLTGRDMRVSCPMQDDYLRREDLSLVQVPEWLKTHEGPVGRCPVRLRPIVDRRRIWPTELVGVECACERSRCALKGAHTCYTVFVTRSIVKREGVTKTLIAVDCVCAAQKARLIKLSNSPIVD